MKKALMLLVMCFILTGCSTEVNLKIDEEKVYERIKIFDLKNNVYINNIMREDTKNNLEAFEREYEFYIINEFDSDGYIGKTYEFEEDINLWWEMSHLRPCYEVFELRKTTNYISLNTSDEYRCGYLFGANDVKLVIESDLELNNSNADKVEGNKLIWNINKDNYNNKSIRFSYKLIDSDQNVSVVDEENEKSESGYIKYVLFTLGIIFLIFGLVIFVKIKNSNK